MSENGETEWRAAGGAEAAQEEKAAAAPTEEDEEEENKGELQERVQARAEDLGGEEASLITETEEEKEGIPIAETKYESPSKKARKTRKSSKSKAVPKKDINLISMSRQLEKQSRQLARIEKVIQSLQSSFNKIDRQSNTIKQLYGIVTQLRRQMHRQIQQQQQRRTQKKKGKDGITSPKK
jgi:hypothetical protein